MPKSVGVLHIVDRKPTSGMKEIALGHYQAGCERFKNL